MTDGQTDGVVKKVSSLQVRLQEYQCGSKYWQVVTCRPGRGASLSITPEGGGGGGGVVRGVQTRRTFCLTSAVVFDVFILTQGLTDLNATLVRGGVGWRRG